MGYSARTSDSGAGGGGTAPTPARRSTWRRMSFIGSTERMRGTVSKLLTGGGDVVNHSSVLAFHGSGPAIAPRFTERITLMIVSRIPRPRMKAPIVEIRLRISKSRIGAYW